MTKILNYAKSHKFFFVLLIFVLLGYIRQIAFWSQERTYIFGDTTTYALHLSYLAQNLWSIFDPKNSILLWNPYYYAGGLPFLSIIDSGIFYPLNFIIAFIAAILRNPLLTIPLYNYSIFLHLALGGYFLYKLLHDFFDIDENSALVGALLWIFIGFNVEFVAAGDIVMNGAFIPILSYLMLYWRKVRTIKSFAIYFGVLACSLFLGYPIIPFIAYVLSVVMYFIFDDTISVKKIIAFGKQQLLGVFLITLPIISPLYFSAILNFSYSVRSQLPLDSLFQNSASQLNFLESIVPMNKLFGTATSFIYVYLSLIGVIIFLQTNKTELFKDRKNGILLFIGALGLLLAFGSISFLPYILYFLMPGINLFRRLAIFSVVPSFVFCILVARSFRSAVETKIASQGSKLIIGVLFVLLVLLQVVLVLGLHSLLRDFNFELLFQSLLLSFLLSVLTLCVLLFSGSHKKLALWGVVILLLIDFGTTVAARKPINSTVDPVKFFGENSIISNLKNRMASTDRADIANIQNNYKTDYLELEQTSGYLSVGSEYGVEINNALHNTSTNAQNLQRLLGIKYVVDYFKPGEDVESGGNVVISVTPEDFENKIYYKNIDNKWGLEPEGTRFILRENKDILSRAFLARNVNAAAQTKEIIPQLIKGDPRDVYVNSTDMQDAKITNTGKVSIDEYKRNYLKATVDTIGDAYLVNTVANYPGWSVKVNGKPVKPIQTNWMMIGTYLPDGKNIVEFSYSSLGLTLGLVYIGGAALIWFYLRRKSNLDKISK